MMVSTTSHPVLKRVHLFASKLQNCAEVARFRLAEEQVEHSSTVQELIQTIKKKQKELVHAKHYQKTAYQRQLEKELEELNRKLENLPIVREYQQSQVEMNDLVQTIQKILVDALSEKIDVEVGKAAASGCGSGGACGCRTLEKM